MAVRLKGFDRELTLFLKELEPAALSRELAAFAKAELSDAIRRGEAPPTYRRIVDGVEGAAEEAVRPDGKIVYDFAYWADVIDFALSFARERSPVLSGVYRDSWFALVNGALWAGGDVPPQAQVIITNDRPYHRKVEVGAMEMRVPPGVVEDLYQAVARRFGNLVRPDVRFIQLDGGYVLKGRQLSQAQKYQKRITAGGPNVRGNSYATRRKDTRAGESMTYPALILTPR